MENLERVKGRVQKPEERVTNFLEVELGFNDEEAKQEASRCLSCPNPRCRQGCPVNIAIPDFISAIKEGDIAKAYDIISQFSSLPAVCGRVCPQEKQCEKLCVRGIKSDAIAIGTLERYVADYAHKNNLVASVKCEKKNKKVAIVGSGPSGITCAGDLAKNGYDVTIYEVLHKAGGVLTYGIPEFRLPKEIVKKELEGLEKLGVKILTDVPIGNALTIDDLKKHPSIIMWWRSLRRFRRRWCSSSLNERPRYTPALSILPRIICSRLRLTDGSWGLTSASSIPICRTTRTARSISVWTIS